MNKPEYISPKVIVVDVAHERGFAGSTRPEPIPFPLNEEAELQDYHNVSNTGFF